MSVCLCLPVSVSHTLAPSLTDCKLTFRETDELIRDRDISGYQGKEEEEEGEAEGLES